MGTRVRKRERKAGPVAGAVGGRNKIKEAAIARKATVQERHCARFRSRCVCGGGGGAEGGRETLRERKSEEEIEEEEERYVAS